MSAKAEQFAFSTCSERHPTKEMAHHDRWSRRRSAPPAGGCPSTVFAVFSGALPVNGLPSPPVGRGDRPLRRVERDPGPGTGAPHGAAALLCLEGPRRRHGAGSLRCRLRRPGAPPCPHSGSVAAPGKARAMTWARNWAAAPALRARIWRKLARASAGLP